jgi:hypothetical protein
MNDASLSGAAARTSTPYSEPLATSGERDRPLNRLPPVNAMKDSDMAGYLMEWKRWPMRERERCVCAWWCGAQLGARGGCSDPRMDAAWRGHGA